MKNQGVYRVLLSLFLVYHLIGIILFPNPSSLLTRAVEPLWAPYGNQFFFNTTWQFFSPNPGLIRYLEYEVRESKVTQSDDEPDIDFKTYTWPPRDRGSLWRENYNRRNYHGLRSTFSGEKLEKFFFPFLCRLHPEAQSIFLKAASTDAPSMERVAIEKGNFNDLNKLSGFPIQEYYCPQRAGVGP